MKTIVPLALLCALAPGVSCNNGYGVLLAKQVQTAGELVGGPVAMATVGDFLLQNDQIRVNILGAKDSPGPGVFGGSIVDVDVRRDRLGFEDGQGHDRFAELFPVTNLLVPNPDPALTQVFVLDDGSNGTEAAIRVEGEGAPLFEALGILHNEASTLRLLFPDVKTSFRFQTDYILRPGDRHVVIRSTIVLEDPPTADGCAVTAASCGLADCEFGLEGDGKGCFTCACSQPIPLDQYHGPVSVFGQIFGDNQNMANPTLRGGVVAGDFVFFGNQTDVFAPGIGFDTDKVVHDAFYTGRNTFQQPLSFDFVTAAGGDVSYGYFTVAAAAQDGGDTQPVAVNMPLFTSAATAFLSAGKSCLYATSDDATCDAKRSFTYERYLAVGQGDIASVSDEAWKTRGTPTGTLSGVVINETSGAPSTKARVYVFKDPQPGHAWGSLDALTAANTAALGSVGLIDEADADVGLPLVLNGSYQATLPAGDYVLVARSQDGMSLSAPQSFQMTAGGAVVANPVVVTPGTVQYQIVDEGGNLAPAKVALVSLDAQGNPLEGDGLRRVYLGDARFGNGVRALDYPTAGQGSLSIEPGSYRFRATRGPEYGIYEQDFTVGAGGVQLVNAVVPREVDTTGWMSADMHLHATLSFDSGMDLPKRVSTVVSEGVEFAVSTDHDFVTDYTPTIRSLLLEPYVATAIGVETTTIEQGHFIAFPLGFNDTLVPTNGSPDPTCAEGGDILDNLRRIGSDPTLTPFTIVAHPRDGFFGYMYQLGVDPYTMTRKVSSLEADNPVLQTASCDFDGMELINGKRFDLVRTPTIEEVVDWNRCHLALEATTTPAQLAGICPLITTGMLAPCTTTEPFAACLSRNRTALAWAWMKRILTRTPEEQEALWSFGQTSTTGTPMLDAQPLCNVAPYGQTPVPGAVGLQPCTYYSGHVDDYFRYLEHGMLKTHVASSDSHEAIHEPGYPRTFFQSPTDAPGSLTTRNVVESLRAGTAFTTYGPFLRGTVAGKTFGEIAPATSGGTVALDLSVQTASWFGVDRIEVYVDGHLVQVVSPQSQPSDIVDYSGTLQLTVPTQAVRSADSWIVVIAMGLQDQNLMRPGSLDLPYGEIQLATVTADAFALIPVVNTFFAAAPPLPDWYPIPAYAVSNPIYLDVNGNGKYDAPLAPPVFCSAACAPDAAPTTCLSEQDCVVDARTPGTGLCGYSVSLADTCTHRHPWVCLSNLDCPVGATCQGNTCTPLTAGSE